MKFGTKITTVKYRDGKVYLEETVCEERVRIMKIGDYDKVIQGMHLKHAISDGYGAWLEKHDDGKMYVVKRWLIKDI